MIGTTVVCDVDGVLSDGHSYVDAEGRESLRFHKRDGWLLDDARKANLNVVLVTDDTNPHPATMRAVKLGLPLWSTARREVFNTAGFWTPAVGSKVEVVRFIKSGDAKTRVVYIGDSPADLEAMREADEPWCPADARLGRDALWDEHGSGEGDRPSYVIDSHHRVTIAQTIGGHGVLHEVLGYLLARAK